MCQFMLKQQHKYVDGDRWSVRRDAWWSSWLVRQYGRLWSLWILIACCAAAGAPGDSELGPVVYVQPPGRILYLPDTENLNLPTEGTAALRITESDSGKIVLEQSYQLQSIGIYGISVDWPRRNLAKRRYACSLASGAMPNPTVVKLREREQYDVVFLFAETPVLAGRLGDQEARPGGVAFYTLWFPGATSLEPSEFSITKLWRSSTALPDANIADNEQLVLVSFDHLIRLDTGIATGMTPELTPAQLQEQPPLRFSICEDTDAGATLWQSQTAFPLRQPPTQLRPIRLHDEEVAIVLPANVPLSIRLSNGNMVVWEMRWTGQAGKTYALANLQEKMLFLRRWTDIAALKQFRHHYKDLVWQAGYLLLGGESRLAVGGVCAALHVLVSLAPSPAASGTTLSASGTTPPTGNAAGRGYRYPRAQRDWSDTALCCTASGLYHLPKNISAPIS